MWMINGRSLSLEFLAPSHGALELLRAGASFISLRWAGRMLLLTLPVSLPFTTSARPSASLESSFPTANPQREKLGDEGVQCNKRRRTLEETSGCNLMRVFSDRRRHVSKSVVDWWGGAMALRQLLTIIPTCKTELEPEASELKLQEEPEQGWRRRRGKLWNVA